MGRVAGSYGVRGLIRVRPYSAEPEALAAHRKWRIGAEDYGVEETKVHSGALLARLAGIGTREQALRLKGKAVSVPRAALPEPEAGAFYHADLIGLKVEDASGNALGTVSAVHNFGAGDVLEIEFAGGETELIPFTDANVPVVDIAHGRIVVELPNYIEE